LSFQTGYRRLQGGLQAAAVGVHRHFTFPLRPHLFGYRPWNWFGSVEEIPVLPCREADGAGIRAACRAMHPSADAYRSVPRDGDEDLSGDFFLSSRTSDPF